MAKLLKFGDDSTQSLLAGAEKLKEAVATTLGPRGRNVAIKNPWGTPSVIHDGVKVAKSIELVDPFEDTGAQLIKESAIKANDVAGDGTTTAVIVAHSIATEALKGISMGQNPMVLRKGIEKAVEHVDGVLRQSRTPVATEKDGKPSESETRQIATVSAQNEEIGDLIARAIKRLGRDGIVTVEDANATEMSIEFKEGMEFDRGIISPYFITDPERAEASINDPYILVTDKTISDQADFLPMLEAWALTPKPRGSKLVIIAGDVMGQPLATLVVNKVQQNVQVMAIKAPGFGDQRKAQLEDIATLVGATFISDESGQSLAGLVQRGGPDGKPSIDLDTFGHATRVTATRDNTTIVGGYGDPTEIQRRATSLKNQLEKPMSEFEMEKIKERLAKLTSGVAVINIGAHSEAEIQELKERAIDAISATKAALEEGTVPGGETALLRGAYALDDLKKEASEDELLGIGIVQRALALPFRRLLSNAGLDAAEYLPQLKNAKTGKLDSKLGVDVTDGTVKDLVKAGILDPVKVTRSALQAAKSSAIMFMTTDVTVVDAPEEKKGDNQQY
jgi:chaperonin GroEL